MNSVTSFQVLDMGYCILQKISSTDNWEQMTSVIRSDDIEDWQDIYWKAKNYCWVLPKLMHPKAYCKACFPAAW